MEATECSIFLTPATVPPGIDDVIKRLHMQHVIVPEQDEWLDDAEPVDHYPFERTYEQSRLDPITIIHTSGSTGEH